MFVLDSQEPPPNNPSVLLPLSLSLSLAILSRLSVLRKSSTELEKSCSRTPAT